MLLAADPARVSPGSVRASISDHGARALGARAVCLRVFYAASSQKLSAARAHAAALV